MKKQLAEKNRFGNEAVTAIPENVPLAKQPGHKLRTSNVIVDRSALTGDAQNEKLIDTQALEKLHGQDFQYVQFGDQTGVVRIPEGDTINKEAPNSFTGPSFRNKQERFRFDGHKMLHHLDRVMAWQQGERFAPIHIDMGLTKFCNTACIYCYAVVQNMTKGKMIERDALLRFIEDCGRMDVRSLGFIGDGEPTLNPAMYDATVLAGQNGIDTSMATNGLMLDMDRAHDLLANMSWIRFNLSAGTAAGFNRVHQSKAKNFDLLIDKIRTLVQIKKQHGYKCTLGLQMVLIPECYDEV
ncbi:radical SAM protein, partial [Kaarinaea lacus]